MVSSEKGFFYSSMESMLFLNLLSAPETIRIPNCKVLWRCRHFMLKYSYAFLIRLFSHIVCIFFFSHRFLNISQATVEKYSLNKQQCKSFRCFMILHGCGYVFKQLRTGFLWGLLFYAGLLLSHFFSVQDSIHHFPSYFFKGPWCDGLPNLANICCCLNKPTTCAFIKLPVSDKHLI